MMLKSIIITLDDKHISWENELGNIVYLPIHLMTLEEWAQVIDSNCEAKGWNTPTIEEVLSRALSPEGDLSISFDELIVELKKARNESEWAILAVSEITEAFEEYRNGKELVYIDPETNKPEGLAIEYADCMIRILHWFARHKINPSTAIAMKMKYNMTRPFRHGNKLA